MVVVFNTFNVSYSAGLQIRYPSDMLVLNYALAAIFVGFIVVAVLLLLLSPNDADFGEFKLHFKRSNALRRNYFALLLLYRTALGFALSYFNEVE